MGVYERKLPFSGIWYNTQDTLVRGVSVLNQNGIHVSS